MDELLWHAWLGGLLLVLASAPLGVFLVWRRMAYFGETLAHAALLGIALGFLFEINALLSVAASGTVIALCLVWLQQHPSVSSDTLLGILSHSSLAIGLLVLAWVQPMHLDLMGYLFGDILTITRQELILMAGITTLVLLIMAFIWRPLLAMTVHADIARVEGIARERVNFVYMVLIALLVAAAMKIVGLLLVTSLLLIPTATARRLANSPEQMVFTAAILGLLAVSMGLALSWQWDLPTGPAIVATSSALFVLSLLLPRR